MAWFLCFFHPGILFSRRQTALSPCPPQKEMPQIQHRTSDVVTTATLQLPSFSWSFSKTVFPKQSQILFSLRDLHTSCYFTWISLALILCRIDTFLFFRPYLFFACPFFMFYCSCCYSRFNYYPPPPNLPPLPLSVPTPLFMSTGPSYMSLG